MSERFLERMDEGYRKAIHVALNHRPTVIGGAAALVVAAALIYPQIETELMPQTDEGEVNINAELAVGTRIERTEEALLRLQELIKEYVPEATTVITQGGGGGNNYQQGGGSTHRGQIRVMLVPRDQRKRTNEQIAIALRRQLAGLPGVVVRANPAGGNNQIMRFLSGGGGNNNGAVEPPAAGDSRPRPRRRSPSRAGRPRDDGRHAGNRRRQRRS